MCLSACYIISVWLSQFVHLPAQNITPEHVIQVKVPCGHYTGLRCCFLVTKTRNDLNWSKMTKNDLKWPKMIKNNLCWWKNELIWGLIYWHFSCKKLKKTAPRVFFLQSRQKALIAKSRWTHALHKISSKTSLLWSDIYHFCVDNCHKLPSTRHFSWFFFFPGLRFAIFGVFICWNLFINSKYSSIIFCNSNNSPFIGVRFVVTNFTNVVQQWSPLSVSRLLLGRFYLLLFL